VRNTARRARAFFWSTTIIAAELTTSCGFKTRGVVEMRARTSMGSAGDPPRTCGYDEDDDVKKKG